MEISVEEEDASGRPLSPFLIGKGVKILLNFNILLDIPDKG